jgi:carbon starvation protein
VAGAVQDFVILVGSLRRNGRSLPQIARDEIGAVTGAATAIAVLFVVIVALAGLGLAVVNALAHNAWGTFTLAMTIPIALGMGRYLNRWRPGRVGEVSLIGVLLLLTAIVLGRPVAASAVGTWFDLGRESLIWWLAGYGLLASVLPVWLLLAPRDYLSSFMKVGVVVLLAAGVVAMAPELQMPPTTAFVDGGGPIIPGTLFPFVFITIACGAISGFHSLICSGTTPKMLDREGHALVGYGAMLMESFVGVMALIAASILIPGDYFAINTMLPAEQLTAMGFPPVEVGELSQMVETNVQGRPGGAVSLAVGMATIFASVPGLRGLIAYWYQFALLFEALFILTTIDAGTRVARYLVQEMGSSAYRRFGDLNWAPGVVLASGAVVAAWGYLIANGSISTIWPMFGAANQLLGTLALCVGTTLLIKMGKARYLWVTAVPMVFVGTITFTASWQLYDLFSAKAAAATVAKEAFNFRLDAALVASVALLAVIILVESARLWYGYLVQKRPYRTTEVMGAEVYPMPSDPTL